MEQLEFYENPECIGTQSYHRTTFIHSFVSTDGVIEMFKTLQCFWIGDVVASRLPDLKVAAGDGTFFVVKVIRDDGQCAKFTIDDGDGRILISQKIEYTDLTQNVRMFLEYSDETWIMMLPSEY
jgi:hypothetical protein